MNGWRNFTAETSKMIKTHFNRLIKEEPTVDGLLKGLRALSVCKHEARSMRHKILKKALHNLNNKNPDAIGAQAGIDGLQGMAGCGYAPEGQDQLIEKIIQNLNGH